MYFLYAKTSAFADTFNDPIKSDFRIAKSESKEKIEELLGILTGHSGCSFPFDYKNVPILKEIADFENSKSFWSDRKDKKFKIQMKDGEIEINYFPVYNYYGSGSLDEFYIDPPIELEPEIDCPTI